MAYENLNLPDNAIPEGKDISHIEEGMNELSNSLAASEMMDGEGTSIPDGADLNDYTSPGKYFTAASSVTNSLLNCPESGSGITLFVFETQPVSTDRNMQFLVNSYSNRFWIRASKTSSSWNSWGQISTIATTNLSNETAEDA